jgi:hypothetical protein
MFVLLVVTSLFQTDFKPSADLLSCASNTEGLMGKTHELDELPPGVSYSAVGMCLKFNKVSLNRNTHKMRLRIDQLTKMLRLVVFKNVILYSFWDSISH